jgi:hypothetical protein
MATKRRSRRSRSTRSSATRRPKTRRSRHGNAPPAATREWIRERIVPYRGADLIVYRHAKAPDKFQVHVKEGIFGSGAAELTVSGKSQPAVVAHAKRVVDAISS